MITRERFNEIKKMSLFKSKVVTGSMVPVIQIGEEIVVEVGNFDIKRFDIVVIFSQDKLVCHYLWSMNERVLPKLLQTRNMSGMKDYPVREEDYLGKVISHRLSLWQKIKFLFK